MNNKLKVSISYITNFKPSDFNNFKKLNFFKNDNKKKLISRNFFLFLFLIKYINVKNKFNISLFIKPTFKKFITLLRAPYRHKLARHQFIFSRYFVLFTINTPLNNIQVNFNIDLIKIINLIKSFYI